MKPQDLLRERIAIAGALSIAALQLGYATWLAFQEEPLLFLSPMELAGEAIFILGCAWGLTRHSRTAVILLALTQLTTAISVYTATSMGWLAIAAAFCLIASLQAIAPIWRLQRQSARSSSAFLTALGAALGLGLAAAIIWFAETVASMPPLRVMPVTQLPSSYVERMQELGIPGDAGEELLYFYSPALGSFDTEFYALTDSHVVAYGSDWLEPLIRMPYGEIRQVESFYGDSWHTESLLYVLSASDVALAIPLPGGSGGASRFVAELRQRCVQHGGSLEAEVER